MPGHNTQKYDNKLTALRTFIHIKKVKTKAKPIAELKCIVFTHFVHALAYLVTPTQNLPINLLLSWTFIHKQKIKRIAPLSTEIFKIC